MCLKCTVNANLKFTTSISGYFLFLIQMWKKNLIKTLRESIEALLKSWIFFVSSTNLNSFRLMDNREVNHWNNTLNKLPSGEVGDIFKFYPHNTCLSYFPTCSLHLICDIIKYRFVFIILGTFLLLQIDLSWKKFVSEITSQSLSSNLAETLPKHEADSYNELVLVSS